MDRQDRRSYSENDRAPDLVRVIPYQKPDLERSDGTAASREYRRNQAKAMPSGPGRAYR
jgi:hypothetical protein